MLLIEEICEKAKVKIRIGMNSNVQTLNSNCLKVLYIKYYKINKNNDFYLLKYI